MANPENLRPPFTSTNPKEAREFGRKGGSVKSPRKKYMARLRELRKKGLTNDTYKRIVNKLDEPESWVLDTMLFLDSLKGKLKDKPVELIKLLSADINLLKAHHGQKHKIEGELTQKIEPITVNIIRPEEKRKDGKPTNKES